MNSYQMVLHRPVETAPVLSKFTGKSVELGQNTVFRKPQNDSQFPDFRLALLYLLAGVGHMPHRPRAVVRDEERAVVRDCDTDGAPPDLNVFRSEERRVGK